MKVRKLNKKRVFYAVIIFILVVLFSITAIKVVSDLSVKEEKKVKKQLDEIKPYGYKLDESDTSTYRKYFKQLKKVLEEEEINYEDYAKLLSKLFVVDFYTLDNKLTSTDIGSLEFIHEDMVENFKLNAQETMYNHVQSNLYSERKQELPIVKAVKVNKIEATKYEYDENEYDGYKVELIWNYKKDLGYENNATLILIKDDNKLNVVEKEEKQDEESSE